MQRRRQLQGFGARALCVVSSFAMGLGAWQLGEQSASAQDAAAASAEAVIAGDLLAYKARLTVSVTRADDSARKAELIVQRHGGRMVARQDDDLTVEVPRAHFDSVIRELSSLGAEVARSVEVTNVTEQWLDAQASLRSAEQARARLWGMGKLAADGVKDPILLHQEIARVDDEIASLRARIVGLQSQASHAVVELSLEGTEGEETETVSPFELPFPWLSHLGLSRLMDLQRSFEPPSPEEASYHLHDEGEVSVGLTFMRPSSPERLGDTAMTVAGAARVRGMFETDPIGPAIGMDMGLGSGLDGGLLYDLRMMVGPGVTIGRHVSVGVLTGAGISGLTGGHIPFGVDLPVEAFVATDVTQYAQVRLWGRSSWIAGSEERQNGAEHAPFGDEAYTGASFIFGEGSEGEDRERVGLSLGVWAGEMLGTGIGGVSIGYGGGFGDRRMSY